jgi:hypothetical protein
VRLCIDCRWCSGKTEDALCQHPKTPFREASLVTGRVIEKPWPCNVVRMHGPLFACGPDGKLWEPKEDAP